MPPLNHPILEQSFAVIDREIGPHSFTPQEYAIVRRVIHSTADFEFKHLLHFSSGAIERSIEALRQGIPIVTDVSMVKQGIQTLVAQTFQNQIISAVEQAQEALPGKTRTETGLLACWQQFPEAVYVIGNAPTALLTLCRQLEPNLPDCNQLDPNSLHRQQLQTRSTSPALIIGAPVGFISVLESKAALAQSAATQIRVEGRKGGSAVAAAILNALLVLAWQTEESGQ